MPFPLLHRSAGVLLLGSTLLLTACNDNDNPNASVGGTAAVGAPLVGATVNLRCQNGVTAVDTTDNNGAWSVSVARSSLPCAVQLTGGTVGVGGALNTEDYYSVTMSSASSVVVNITPLTTLALAGANGTALDDTWFDNLNDAGLESLAVDALASLATFASTLDSLGYTLPGDSFNPFALRFSPVGGNAYDDLLEQFKAALEDAGTDFDTLLASFAAGGELPAALEGEGGGGGSGTGGSSEGLTPTAMDSDEFGVRFNVNGTVNGATESNVARYWPGPFSFEDQTASTFTAYANIEAGDMLYDSFSFKNLPNTPGTYDCGDAFGTSLGRNIEFSFGGGNGFSTMGTKGVTGFTCSITITQGRVYHGGLYYGAMLGSFQARFFKTGQMVNLGDSIFVSGNFRLGDVSAPPFIPPTIITPAI